MAQTQLQIAESSHRIATMTMRDSAAMRTIAMLTMIFLPGTAIAVRPDWNCYFSSLFVCLFVCLCELS